MLIHPSPPPNSASPEEERLPGYYVDEKKKKPKLKLMSTKRNSFNRNELPVWRSLADALLREDYEPPPPKMIKYVHELISL